MITPETLQDAIEKAEYFIEIAKAAQGKLVEDKPHILQMVERPVHLAILNLYNSTKEVVRPK